MEYWVNPLNPTNARERFRESMDVLMQAWTEPGPTRDINLRIASHDVSCRTSRGRDRTGPV
jgi:hypothetical protein